MQQIKFYGLNSSGWNDLASDNKKMEAKVKKKKERKRAIPNGPSMNLKRRT
jgi:hypothetical protein